MFNTKAAVIALTLAFAGGALAQTATPNLDKRIDNQQKRIDQGVQSGELTKREAARLQQRQDKLQADKAKAQADGVVTNKERRQLEREADRNSRAISREKHDAQKRK